MDFDVFMAPSPQFDTGIPNNFDVLSAIEDWVEKDEAPDAIVAKMYYPPGPSYPGAPPPPENMYRTMPLCKFPEMAHYGGKGDVNDASNWTYPAGDTSMLKVGESGRQAGVVY